MTDLKLEPTPITEWARTLAHGIEPQAENDQSTEGVDLIYTALSPPLDETREAAVADDANLRLLADLVDERDALDARIRAMLCLYREWAHPPYPLSTLATVARSSIAGVRTSYSDTIRIAVEEITGREPRTPRDPQRLTWAPTDNPAGQIHLGVDLDGVPVGISADEGLAIIADPNRPDTRLLQRLILHQIIDSHLPNWTRESDPDKPGAVELGAAIQFVLTLSGDMTEYLYGDVRDTFTRNGTRHRYSDTIPTFTEHQQRRFVHVARSAAPAEPPQSAILIGDLEAPARDWQGVVPIISAARRSHQWDWTLIPSSDGDARPITFRLSKPSTKWVDPLLGRISPEMFTDARIGQGVLGMLRTALSR